MLQSTGFPLLLADTQWSAGAPQKGSLEAPIAESHIFHQARARDAYQWISETFFFFKYPSEMEVMQ